MNLIATLLTNLFFWILCVLVFVTGRKEGVIFLVIFWFITTDPIARAFISPLENRFKQPSIFELKQQGIKLIVVLVGGGAQPRGEITASALPAASINRFLAGLELWARLGPDCKLIFSGSSGPNAYLPTSEMMKDVASTINPERIFFAESESATTAEHPVFIRKLVRDEQFVLVTSAYHMPRAMGIFRSAKLNPVAYPVDYLYTPQKWYSWSDFLPSTENLRVLEVGVREYFATILHKLTKG